MGGWESIGGQLRAGPVSEGTGFPPMCPLPSIMELTHLQGVWSPGCRWAIARLITHSGTQIFVFHMQI